MGRLWLVFSVGQLRSFDRHHDSNLRQYFVCALHIYTLGLRTLFLMCTVSVTQIDRLTDDLPHHEDQGNDTGYDQLVPSLLGGLGFLGLLMTLTPKCICVCVHVRTIF